jgi:hypothetical protein
MTTPSPPKGGGDRHDDSLSPVFGGEGRGEGVPLLTRAPDLPDHPMEIAAEHLVDDRG